MALLENGCWPPGTRKVLRLPARAIPTVSFKMSTRCSPTITFPDMSLRSARLHARVIFPLCLTLTGGPN